MSSNGESPPEKGDSKALSESTGTGGTRKRSGALVWLALLLALASIGLSSYPFWSEWIVEETFMEAPPTSADFESLADRVDQVRQDSVGAIEEVRADLAELSAVSGESDPALDTLSEQIDELGVRLKTLEDEQNAAFSGVRGRIEELESKLELRLEQFEKQLSNGGGDLAAVRARIADLEAELGRRLEQFEMRLSNVGSDLDRADHDLSTRLLLMEIDSLFAIAQNQLAVSGDPTSAVVAWERGLQRLPALSGAEFDGLKAVARREYSKLKAFNPPQIGPRVERLYRISDEVSRWPVRTEQSDRIDTSEAGDGGWKERLGSVLDTLVQVETADSEFLRPGEIELVRERLRTMLHTSALAVVRSRLDLAGQLAGEATAVARRFFDSESSEVSRALAWLDEFAADDDGFAPPTLTASRVEISRLLGEVR